MNHRIIKNAVGGAVALLILGSLNTMVGYQIVQSSHQNLFNKGIPQKELLLQSIVDIANTKEIQRIILKSQRNRGLFLQAEIPSITKNHLKIMYFIGLLLSKSISKSRMQLLIQQYRMSNPTIQKEISTVIESNPRLTQKITRLSDLSCDCGYSNVTLGSHPFLCYLVLFPMFIFLFFVMAPPMMIVFGLGTLLNIHWLLEAVWIWILLVTVTWYISSQYVLGCTWLTILFQ